MNINLDLYSYFYYVCEFKSITKAANYLYISQPAITKQIKKLEKLLGKSLIIRTSKGIDLTEDGEFLYHKIKQPIESLNHTEACFKETCDKYDITITLEAGHSSLTKFLEEPIIEFNKLHPTIKFKLTSHHLQESLQLIKEEKIDLKFISLGSNMEKYADLLVEKFLEVDDIFVISKELKGKIPSKIKLIDLNNYPTIVLSNDIKDILSKKFLDNYFIEHGLTFKPKYELVNNWLIEEYVSLNVGIGVLARQHIIDKLESGELIEIETDVKIPKRTMAYVFKKTSLKYPVIREFINFVKQYNNIDS